MSNTLFRWTKFLGGFRGPPSPQLQTDICVQLLGRVPSVRREN